ncbi:MAG: cyclase family protein, partial [Eubacteriales bacterium]
MKEYLDITLPITHRMLVYPTDTPCTVEKVMSIKNGDIVNLNELSLCAHTGTHIDAPYHFFEDGKKIEELDEKQLMGKAKVFDFSNKQYYIDKNDLLDKGIE